MPNSSKICVTLQQNLGRLATTDALRLLAHTVSHLMMTRQKNPKYLIK